MNLARRRASLWFLLVSTGLAGAAFGAATASWQVSLETSQVLLGLVPIDPTSLPYAYHVSAISLINYLGCALLALSDSEVISSVLLAALIGAAALQAVALIVFLVVRDAILAAWIAIALGGINHFGAGISYPIFFLGTPHVYGRAGLIVFVYALGLLGLARYRSGFFLCGLAPCVHPLWGLWLNGCLVLALGIGRKRLGEILCRRNAAYYFAGVALTVAVFAWQRLTFPVDLAVTVGGIEESQRIFLGYVRHWDHHRRRFDAPVLLIPGLVYTFLTVAFLARFHRSLPGAGGRLFSLVAAISAVASVPLVFIPSWFDPDLFPRQLVVAMPGRFVNAAIFLATPLWVGALAAALEQRRANLLLASLLGVLFWLGTRSVTGYDPTRPVWMLLGATVPLALLASRHATAIPGFGASWGATVRRVSARLPKGPLPSFDQLVLVSGVGMALYLPLSLFARNAESIVNNFERLALPSEFEGSVLVTFDRWLLQLETRRPTLVPHIDGYAYLGPGALLALEDFTTDLFGISMKDEPPRPMDLHQSVLMTPDYRALWESRSCTEWAALADEYQFGLVVVPGDLRLQLPRADTDGAWGKYLPTCAN